MIIELIGPISPPFNGPGIKNKIILEELQNRNDLYKIYSFNTLKYSFLIKYIFHLIFNIRADRSVILSVSKNGRFLLIPLIVLLTILSRKRKLILLPAGGKFHNELNQIPKYVKLFYLTNLKFFSKIIVETSSLKIGLGKLGIKCSKLPNPRKLIEVKKKNINVNKIKVYFISSIKKEKGIIDAMQAIEILYSLGYNVELVIHGRIMRGFDMEFNNTLDKSPNCSFKGGLANENVISTLSKEADFLLLPTYYPGEGLPGVLVESTIAEVPFLVTKIDGLDDYFIDNESMLVIDKKSPSHIAKQLENLINDQEKYYKICNNQRYTKQIFSVSNFVNKIL